MRSPRLLRLGSSVERVERVLHLPVGDLDELLAGGGVLDRERAARRWRRATRRR